MLLQVTLKISLLKASQNQLAIYMTRYGFLNLNLGDYLILPEKVGPAVRHLASITFWASLGC